MKNYTISAEDITSLKNLFFNLERRLSDIEKENTSKILYTEILSKTKSVDIKILGENLMVGEILIPLVSRKVTFKLIEAFLSNQNNFLTRIQLIERVYNRSYSLCSERMQFALDKNIMKLLSRTRSLLERSLDGGDYRDIRWIIYDEKKFGWYFYK